MKIFEDHVGYPDIDYPDIIQQDNPDIFENRLLKIRQEKVERDRELNLLEAVSRPSRGLDQVWTRFGGKKWCFFHPKMGGSQYRDMGRLVILNGRS